MKARNADIMVFISFLILSVTGCSLQGNAGGCGEPIPGGFPLEKRVEKGAQARVTSNGIEFIRQNYDKLFGLNEADEISFNMPPSTQNIPLVGNVYFCPDGNCTVITKIIGIDILPNPPNTLKIRVTAQIRADSIPFTIDQGIACICWEDCRCDMSLNTEGEPPLSNTFSVSMVFSIDPSSYTKIDIERASIEDDLQSGDVSITNLNLCGWGVCNLLNIGFIKDIILGEVAGRIGEIVANSTKPLLCMQCPDYGCPEGTSCEIEEGSENGFCFYSDGRCVPSPLGFEGRIDISSISNQTLPEEVVPVDMLFRGGGYVDVDTGLNLGFMTGSEPSRETQCASLMGSPPPLGPVPEASALRMDNFSPCVECSASGSECPSGYLCLGGICVAAHYELDNEGNPRDCRGHNDCSLAGSGFRCIDGKCVYIAGECIKEGNIPVMFSFGISKTALTRMIYGFISSGLLCQKFGTKQIPMLTTTTLGAVIPPLQNLAWDEAPVSIKIFPSETPAVIIKDWPLITIQMNSLRADFYEWLHNTYFRIFAADLDLEIALNLSANENNVEPQIVYISATNVRVQNSQILSAPPEELAGLLASLFNTMLPMFLGSGEFPSFQINLPINGIDVSFPFGGITRVSKDEEDFLALFMNMRAGSPSPPPPDRTETEPLETKARIISKRTVPSPGSSRKKMIPEFEISIQGIDKQGKEILDGVEFRYRLDKMMWSNWTNSSAIKISDPIFLLDGMHTLEISARRKGIKETEDNTPAILNLEVDNNPPFIKINRKDDSTIKIDVLDAVTPEEKIKLECRFLPEEHDWKKCEASGIKIPPNALAIEVKATDLAQNSDSQTFEIRGRVPQPPENPQGCSYCPMPDKNEKFGGTILMLILLSFLVSQFNHRKKIKNIIVCFLILIFTSCTFNGTYFHQGCRSSEDCYPGEACCIATGRCISPPPAEFMCDTGWTCNGNIEFDQTTCSFTRSCCEKNPSLEKGRIGTYLSIAINPLNDNEIIVNGYNEGIDSQHTYGDLVSGVWNFGAKQVDWITVDGIPEKGKIVGAPDGWRGGIEAPGEDVGLWTSSTPLPDGTIVIFYYDKTASRLKYATRNSEGEYSVGGIIDDTGDAGIYTSAITTQDGGAGVAYRVTYENPSARGQIISEVRYAHSPNPAGGNWAVETVRSEITPCWKEVCGSSRVCRLDNGLCATPSNPENCNSGEGCPSGVCISGACVQVVDWISDVPQGIGIQNSLGISSTEGIIFLAYYDSTSGDLVLHRRDEAGWSEPMILDGDDSDPASAGNRGWSPSIAVLSSSEVHVAYMDVDREILMYKNVFEGSAEIVDSGNSSPRGPERVGENSSISVDSSGIVRIAYMNASSGKLMMGVRTAPNSWVISDITPETNGVYGFYTTQKIKGNNSIVATFFVQNEEDKKIEDVIVRECYLLENFLVDCN